MELDRRRLLTLAGAAGAAAACRLTPAASATPALRGADGAVDWRAVRGLFDLDPALIHMSSFYLASHPRPVREAIERWRRKIDADPLWIEQAFSPRGGEWARVKAALGRYLGASAEQIAWVPNTTTGLALVYNGLDLAPGDDVLTTEHDHYSHHQAIALAAQKRGAAVRRVALHDGAARATRAEAVARLRAAMRPETRIVGLTWVHSSTGLKLPIAELAAVVAEVNGGRPAAQRCLLVVDGVHGLGVEDVEASSLGADFFVAGTHKWLLGPRGTGLILGRADAWSRLRPTVPSFESWDCWRAYFENQPLPPTEAAFVTPGGFAPFEHLLAIGAAVELQETLGRGNVAARIRELNLALREGLARIPRVTLHTPLDPQLASGIVCFDVDGMTPPAVAAALRRSHIVATESPYARPCARVAAGIMVQPEEVETTLRAIRALV